MSRRSPRNTIILDWFNVTYRSVAWTVLAVVALAGGAGGYWYWSVQVRPREAAVEAIDRAAMLLARAERVPGDDRSEEILASARAALDDARARFGLPEYREARQAALQSSDLSMRVLDRAQGNREDPRSVRFVDLEGDVKVKLAGEFAWTAANGRMTLSVGDQVKTAANGSAVLLYFDGTKTTVKPGSLLEIRDLSEDPVTRVRRVREKLNWGRIEASTQKGNVSGSVHEMATNSAVARAEEEGEYAVSHEEGSGRSSFSTFTGGTLRIATSGRQAALAEGERIVAESDGALSAKDQLPGVPRLTAPQDQKVFVTDDSDGMNISVTWDPVGGARSYRLMIASEALFTDPLYDALRTDTRVPVDVAPGEYFWRVAAATAAGLEGQFSETRHFRVTTQRIRDSSDTTPPDLEISDAVVSGNMLILNGRTEPGSTLWIDNEKQEIDAAGAFSTVVRLRHEGWNDIQLVAQDAAGNERRVTHRVHLDPY